MAMANAPPTIDSSYNAPWQQALRQAPNACVCTDTACELSGGFAHIGPCEACSCGKRHAIEECPHRATPFIFRGKPIDGVSAVLLLKAIRFVQQKAPDATAEDIAVLTDIREQFGAEFERSVAASCADVDAQEDAWLKD